MNNALSGQKAFRVIPLVLAAALLALAAFSIAPAGSAFEAQQAFAATDINGNCTFSRIARQYYTGKKVKPAVTVKFNGVALKRGKDFKVSYSNNKKVGKATATVKGIGTFKGTRSITFRICYDLAKAKIKLPASMFAYTGKRVKPKATVKFDGSVLKKDVDYTVVYSNNKEVGKGVVTLTGKGAYLGTLSKKFKIRYSLEAHGKIKLARTKMPYTGKARKPYATVKYGSKTLTKDTDYTITYSNNKKVGTATVTVTGVGSYGFSISKNFKVTAGGGVIVDISEWQDGLVTSWKKVSRKVDGVILRSYVKLSSSSGQRADRKYDEFATACEKKGIAYGAYGYMIFTSKKKALQQAERFWTESFSNGHEPCYLALDLEDALMDSAGKKVATYTWAAIERIQELAVQAGCKNGVKLGLYVGDDNLSSYGFKKASNKESFDAMVDFVWIPRWGKNDGSVPTLAEHLPQNPYDMWQYTSMGTIAGIDDKTDVSLINAKGPNAHNMGWYMKR